MSLYREQRKDGTLKNGIWMMKIYTKGNPKPIRRSTETTNEKKARLVEAAAKTNLERGAPTAAAIGQAPLCTGGGQRSGRLRQQRIRLPRGFAGTAR